MCISFDGPFATSTKARARIYTQHNYMTQSHPRFSKEILTAERVDLRAREVQQKMVSMDKHSIDPDSLNQQL